MRRRLFGVAVATLVLISTTAPSAVAQPEPVITNSPGEFSRWAGYLADGERSSVRASWVVPAIDCPRMASQRNKHRTASPWVGLSTGKPHRKIAQIGVDFRCSTKTQYELTILPWIEMYPDEAANYFPGQIEVGDTITATVSRDSATFTLSLSNDTRKWRKDFVRNPGWSKTAGAEVILEQVGDQTSPLPYFGTLTFTTAAVNGVPLDEQERLTRYEIRYPDAGTKVSTSDLNGPAFSVTRIS